MKREFAYIDYNSDIIADHSPSAECFASVFQTFLNENGWTEEEYFDQLCRDPKLKECN